MSGPSYVICLSDGGHPESLIVRRLYARLPDAEAEIHGLLRVVDETGEDYLFPRDLFAPVDLPADVLDRLAS